jgi:hypothetical protein
MDSFGRHNDSDIIYLVYDNSCLHHVGIPGFSGKHMRRTGYFPTDIHHAISLLGFPHDRRITMPPAAVKTIRDQIFWQYAEADLEIRRTFQRPGLPDGPVCKTPG